MDKRNYLHCLPYCHRIMNLPYIETVMLMRIHCGAKLTLDFCLYLVSKTVSKQEIVNLIKCVATLTRVIPGIYIYLSQL